MTEILLIKFDDRIKCALVDDIQCNVNVDLS